MLVLPAFNRRPFNFDLVLIILYFQLNLQQKNPMCALGGASLYNLTMIC